MAYAIAANNEAWEEGKGWYFLQATRRFVDRDILSVIAKTSTKVLPIGIKQGVKLGANWATFAIDPNAKPAPSSFSFNTVDLDAAPVVYLSGVSTGKGGSQEEIPSEFQLVHPLATH